MKKQAIEIIKVITVPAQILLFGFYLVYTLLLDISNFIMNEILKDEKNEVR